MNNQGELVDLPAALLQLTTLAAVGVAMWAALVALLASWRPTKRIAMALTPRLIRAAVFTTVSGTLVIGPAHADSDLDGLPFPDRGTTAEPSAGLDGRASRRAGRRVAVDHRHRRPPA